MCFFLVDGGHRAVIFDRFRGVLPTVSGEGTHFLVPWVQRPIIFDIRSKPRNVPVVTGSKGNILYLYLVKVGYSVTMRCLFTWRISKQFSEIEVLFCDRILWWNLPPI